MHTAADPGRIRRWLRDHGPRGHRQRAGARLLPGRGPEGTRAARSVAYDWDFGDGTARASGVDVEHSVPAAGEFTLTLVVRDDAGLGASRGTPSPSRRARDRLRAPGSRRARPAAAGGSVTSARPPARPRRRSGERRWTSGDPASGLDDSPARPRPRTRTPPRARTRRRLVVTDDEGSGGTVATRQDHRRRRRRRRRLEREEAAAVPSPPTRAATRCSLHSSDARCSASCGGA